MKNNPPENSPHPMSPVSPPPIHEGGDKIDFLKKSMKSAGNWKRRKTDIRHENITADKPGDHTRGASLLNENNVLLKGTLPFNFSVKEQKILKPIISTTL